MDLGCVFSTALFAAGIVPIVSGLLDRNRHRDRGLED